MLVHRVRMWGSWLNASTKNSSAGFEQLEQEPLDRRARVDDALAEHAVADVEQHAEPDRHALVGELRDGLRLAVLVDLERLTRQAGASRPLASSTVAVTVTRSTPDRNTRSVALICCGVAGPVTNRQRRQTDLRIATSRVARTAYRNPFAQSARLGRRGRRKNVSRPAKW